MRLLYALPFLVILAAISVFAGPQPCTQPAPPYVYFQNMQYTSGTYLNPSAIPSFLVPSPTYTVGGGASGSYCWTNTQTANIQEVEIWKRVNNGAWTSVVKRSFSGQTGGSVVTTESVVGGTGNVPIEYKVVAKDSLGQFATVSGYIINQDTSNPTITSLAGVPPIGSGSVSGTITVTPVITDPTWYPGSINSVSYSIDNNFVAIPSQAPWSITYDTRQLSNAQPHTIVAQVVDKSGRYSVYTQQFTVNNPSSQTLPPPSPISGAYSGGKVDIYWPAVSGSVKHYTVYRDNYFLGKTQVSSFIDYAPRAGATHSYRVSTTNTLNVEGINSTPLNITIPAAVGIPIGTIAPFISGIKMLTVPAGVGISYLVYQVETPYPATCTASTVTSNAYSPVLGGGLTRLTSPGVFRHNFAVSQGPGYYAIKPVCSYTCGDGICQDSNVGGDEKQGLPGSSPDACPQDCGCPSPNVYNPYTQLCEPPCTVRYDVPPPGQNFRERDCAASTPSNSYVTPGQYCAVSGTQCTTCSPGYYSDLTGAFSCNKFKSNDGVCAWDIGEWDAWYNNGQQAGHECESFVCPMEGLPPGNSCPIGYTGPSSSYCAVGVNLPCLNGCPLRDPILLGCA